MVCRPKLNTGRELELQTWTPLFILDCFNSGGPTDGVGRAWQPWEGLIRASLFRYRLLFLSETECNLSVCLCVCVSVTLWGLNLAGSGNLDWIALQISFSSGFDSHGTRTRTLAFFSQIIGFSRLFDWKLKDTLTRVLSQVIGFSRLFDWKQ